MAYLYKRIIFIDKRESITDTWYHVADSQEDIKWKKTNTKDHVVLDSIYWKHPEYTNVGRLVVVD
jgi:hypothetical protein